MLILTRKPGESLMVGNDIIVTITKVRGGRVEIGVEAPKDATITRKELADTIVRHQKA